jgi:AraC-like DNA-binding protein
MGMTPMQFIAHRRIDRAKWIIAENSSSLSSVAFKVGFNDVTDFIKQFKKITGLTPSSYKDAVQRHIPGNI